MVLLVLAFNTCRKKMGKKHTRLKQYVDDGFFASNPPEAASSSFPSLCVPSAELKAPSRTTYARPKQSLYAGSYTSSSRGCQLPFQFPFRPVPSHPSAPFGRPGGVNRRPTMAYYLAHIVGPLRDLHGRHSITRLIIILGGSVFSPPWK